MPAGTDGQILRADSASTPFGLRWSSESVPSVFGRSGAPVVAQAGDYTASQVTNAVSTIATYPDPAWITSLSWGKLIGVPASFTPAAHTHDAAAIVTGVLSTARLGTGVADNTVYLRGDGTWAAAGTGGGGGVVSVFGRAGQVIAQGGDYTAALVGAIPDNLLTSTGDLLVRNNINQTTRLPIGANGQVLQTDLATSVGMKWTSISASVQTPWVTNIDASNFDLVNVHRLGVALAVPNYAVDVVGDVNYTGVLRSNGVPVVFGGSQTPWTQNINASGFSLNNAGTVGIGVTAPQAAPIQVATHTPGIAGSLAVQDLDATTSGNPVLLVTGLGSEGTRAWAVGCRGGATFLKDLYIWNDRSSDMLFGTNSSERMRITAAGLVGIGTTNPGAKLQVHGGADSTDALQVSGATANQYLALQSSPTAGRILHWTGSSFGNIAICPVVSAGNVGIGTASPTSSLHITSPAGSPSVTYHAAASLNLEMVGGIELAFGGINANPWPSWIQSRGSGNAANPLALNPLGGNVGIGTTQPQVPLQVVKIVSQGPSVPAAGTYGGSVIISNDSPTYGMYIGSINNGMGYIQQQRGDSAVTYPLLLQPNGGNVGIGTASPQSKLVVMNSAGAETAINIWQGGVSSGHIGSKGSDSSFYIVNSYNTGALVGGLGITITTNGNVGILENSRLGARCFWRRELLGRVSGEWRRD